MSNKKNCSHAARMGWTGTEWLLRSRRRAFLYVVLCQRLFRSTRVCFLEFEAIGGGDIKRKMNQSM